MTGTATLARFFLRRDRFLMPWWVIVIPTTLLVQPSATQQLFPTPDQLEVYARTLRTPALVALYGPVFDSSLGALSVTRSGFGLLILGLITMLTVIRHTRTEEEAGRRELVGATVVGRHAPLAAALVTASAASAVVATFIAVGMAAQGLPVAGSVAAGLSYAAVGISFAAVGAVAAQITQGAGASRGIGLVALGVAFVLRMTGDVSQQVGGSLGWMSWLSPIGWGQQLRPYADERWWVLGLSVGFLLVLTFGAVALSSARDVGAGLVPPRPGPAAASPRLLSPFGLALRLHRGSLIGWTVGLFLLGLMFGSIADTIGQLVEASPELAEVFAQMGGEQALTDAYLSSVMGVLGLVGSGYAVQAALRMRSEEAAQRSEPVLAASVSRLRWLSAHTFFAVAGPALALAAGGIAAGMAHGVITGDPAHEMPRVVAAALVQLPAVWMMAGLAVLLFGLLPRLAASASWGLLGFFFLLGWLGPVLQIGQATMNLSPFTHMPKLPGGPLYALPMALVASAAVVLLAVGAASFRRRDIPSV